ncbi:hypothetical protein ACHAWO_005542 [Cyclotella atomus]|uniref:Uncharacterized protein n=1 Tax=Cyclotella atomus TaxID=382360 RepID=A0ABD3NIV3_9STRA
MRANARQRPNILSSPSPSRSFSPSSSWLGQSQHITAGYGLGGETIPMLFAMPQHAMRQIPSCVKRH